MILELCRLGTRIPNGKPVYGKNEVDINKENADQKAKALYKYNHETDELKKLKMKCRIDAGIYNFKDL